MDLYKLSATGGRDTYAVKDLNSVIETERCSCGRMTQHLTESTAIPFSLVIEHNKNFPDFLACCGAGLSVGAFVVSKRAVNAFERNGITGYTAAPALLFVEKNGEYVPVAHAPEYYRLSVAGSIDLDYAQMHLKRKNRCQLCGQYSLSRQKLGTSYLDVTSWSGHDLCRLETFPAMVICSQKVIDVIKSDGLTGASMLDQQHNFMPQYSVKVTAEK